MIFMINLYLCLKRIPPRKVSYWSLNVRSLGRRTIASGTVGLVNKSSLKSWKIEYLDFDGSLLADNVGGRA